MFILTRSLAVLAASVCGGLALVGYVELQNANRVVADVVGAVIVIAIVAIAARIKI
jgi:hypothetical protein